jgi:hypothetical protein
MLVGEEHNCHDPELGAMAVAARRRVGADERSGLFGFASVGS